MSGMSDGVSKLWIVRRNGALDVDGYQDEASAIDALIRHALTRAKPEAVAELKVRIEASVSKALKHLDEEPAPLSEDPDVVPDVEEA